MTQNVKHNRKIHHEQKPHVSRFTPQSEETTHEDVDYRASDEKRDEHSTSPSDPSQTEYISLFAISIIRNPDSVPDMIRKALYHIAAIHHNRNEAIQAIGELLGKSRFEGDGSGYGQVVVPAVEALFDVALDYLIDMEQSKKERLAIINSAVSKLKNNLTAIRAGLEQSEDKKASLYRELIDTIEHQPLDRVGLNELFLGYRRIRRMDMTAMRGQGAVRVGSPDYSVNGDHYVRICFNNVFGVYDKVRKGPIAPFEIKPLTKYGNRDRIRVGGYRL